MMCAVDATLECGGRVVGAPGDARSSGCLPVEAFRGLECAGFYGAYGYSGLVRQVSRFFNVGVSAFGTCRNLDSLGFKGGGKPRPETPETAALRFQASGKPRPLS